MRARAFSALALSACVLGLTASASAQSVALLDPLTNDDVTAEGATLVVERAHTALRAAGWSVVPASEVRARARRARLRCSELECADRLASALSVDWVGQLRIWAALDGSLRQVVLTFANADGVTRQAAADVGEPGVDDAVDRAVAATLRRVAGEEDAVPCAVHGTPIGASVAIDGQPAGTLPWTGMLTPGEHSVVVSRVGFVTARRVFRVTSGSRITIELEHEAGASVAASGPVGAPVGDPPAEIAPPGVTDGGPDVALIVTGGGLAAAGLGALIAGAVVLAEPSTCASPSCDVNTPLEARAVREPDPVVLGTIIGVGSALVVTGAVLLIIGAPSGGPEGGAVGVRDGMLSVSF